MKRKIAIVGTSGSGKTTCLEFLGLQKLKCDMDRLLPTGVPQSMDAMISCILGSSCPVMAVSVHRAGLEEIARAKREGSEPRLSQMFFVYLFVPKEILTIRLREDSAKRTAGNIDGTLQEHGALDKMFREIADHCIDTSSLTTGQVANEIRILMEGEV